MSAIHIVFGETAGITLKAALNQYAQHQWQADHGSLAFVLKAGVLSCMDCFAIGPVFEMDLPSGFFNRLGWISQYLESAMSPEDSLDDVDNVLEAISDFYKRLAWIEPERPIVLWYGNNVVEQFGARVIAGLLPEHPLYGVDLEALKTKLSLDESTCCFGDFAMDHLVEGVREIKPIAETIRKQWFDDWKQLTACTAMLRQWDGKNIHCVTDDFYDGLLVEILSKGPQSPAKFLGEALLKTPHGIDGSFITLRLMHLAECGCIEEFYSKETGLLIQCTACPCVKG